MYYVVYHIFFHLSRGKDALFQKSLQKLLPCLCLRTGQPFFPLHIRENDVLFLCLKEKGRKRSKQPCRLIACAYFVCISKAHSLCAKHKAFRLTKGYFAARGSLEASIVWKPCLTAVVHRQDTSSPKRLFHPRRVRIISPASVRRRSNRLLVCPPNSAYIRLPCVKGAPP